MNIGIVGLGLIGGSLAKAIKKNTENNVFGYDVDKETISKAFLFGAIDGELNSLSDLDMLIVALYPSLTVEYIEKHADEIPRGCIVTDVCGVKGKICEILFPLARKNGFCYIGGHPMAGVEFCGFDHSRDALFKNASMVLVPDKNEDITNVEKTAELFKSLGFTRIQYSTPEEHDKMIALTSQLAHVISSAYVKSPSALTHKGFSAGSFKDMTRVSRLNEKLWTELFFLNRDNLLSEVDILIDHLIEYRDALKQNDKQEMSKLLKDGSDIKILTEKDNAKS